MNFTAGIEWSTAHGAGFTHVTSVMLLEEVSVCDRQLTSFDSDSSFYCLFCSAARTILLDNELKLVVTKCLTEESLWKVSSATAYSDPASSTKLSLESSCTRPLDRFISVRLTIKWDLLRMS
jgi:hypothetical protein